MKNIHSIIFIACCFSAKAQTIKVAASTSSTAQPVYTKTGADNADTLAKKNGRAYTDIKTAAAQTAAINTSSSYAKYLDSLQAARFDSIINSKLQLPKISFSNGFRLDSISPGVYLLVNQFYWDTKTNSIQRNF